MAKKQDQKSPAELESATEAAETLGSHFRRIRLSLHIGLDEAAESTRIHRSTIEALEADNREALPAEVFTRGFIKIYAQYLGIDPEEALNWYLQKTGAPMPIPDEKINAQEVLAGESLAESPTVITGRHIFFALLVGVLALLGYWAYTNLNQPPMVFEHPLVQESDSTIPTEKSASEEKIMPIPDDTAQRSVESNVTDQPSAETAALPETPLTVNQTDAATARPETEDIPASTVSGQQTPEQEKQVESASAQVQPERQKNSETEGATTEAAPVTAAENANESAGETASFPYILQADFVEDTWLRIQVDDAKPKEFFFHPGQQHTWKAQGAMELFIGNAGGVALTLNGTPLPPLGVSGKTTRFVVPLRTE